MEQCLILMPTNLLPGFPGSTLHLSAVLFPLDPLWPALVYLSAYHINDNNPHRWPARGIWQSKWPFKGRRFPTHRVIITALCCTTECQCNVSEILLLFSNIISLCQYLTNFNLKPVCISLLPGRVYPVSSAFETEFSGGHLRQHITRNVPTWELFFTVVLWT